MIISEKKNPHSLSFNLSPSISITHHAFEDHSEFVHNLYKINDNSLGDIVYPQNEPFTQIIIENKQSIEIDKSIKTEEFDPLVENVNVKAELVKNHKSDSCENGFIEAESLKKHVKSFSIQFPHHLP